MRWLIRILSIFLIVLLALAAIVFMSANSEAHQLKFLDAVLLNSEVGKLLLYAFVCGALIGLLAGAPVILSLKRQLARMHKRTAER